MEALCTQMDRAVEACDVDAAVALCTRSPLRQLFSIDHQIEDGSSILHRVVASSDANTVLDIPKLLAAGAQLHGPSGAAHGRTPMLEAAHAGQAWALAQLMEADGAANVDGDQEVDADFRGVLEVAVRGGHTEAALVVVDNQPAEWFGARTLSWAPESADGDLNGNDDDGDTLSVSPVELACLLGNAELARELLKRGQGSLDDSSEAVRAAIVALGGEVAAIAQDPVNMEPVCPQGA